MLLVQVRQAGFQFIYLDSCVNFELYSFFPKHLYMMKNILFDSVLFTIMYVFCPGGVGAIMWACRARDSGSNPGQGASSYNSIYVT